MPHIHFAFAHLCNPQRQVLNARLEAESKMWTKVRDRVGTRRSDLQCRYWWSVMCRGRELPWTADETKALLTIGTAVMGERNLVQFDESKWSVLHTQYRSWARSHKTHARTPLLLIQRYVRLLLLLRS